METKITRCGEHAIYHRHQSEKGSAPARQREKMRAKTQMEERRRLQRQLDKAVVMSNAIQKQIDNILSSNMDMLIVDAMRGFNHVATNMVLPQRLTEVENLGEQLVERQSEVAAMQEAILGIGVNMMMTPAAADAAPEDDSELWSELNDLMGAHVADHDNDKLNNSIVNHNSEPHTKSKEEEEYDDISETTVLLPSVPLTRAYQRQILLARRDTADNDILLQDNPP
jgi:hypothetical protein